MPTRVSRAEKISCKPQLPNLQSRLVSNMKIVDYERSTWYRSRRHMPLMREQAETNEVFNEMERELLAFDNCLVAFCVNIRDVVECSWVNCYLTPTTTISAAFLSHLTCGKTLINTQQHQNLTLSRSQPFSAPRLKSVTISLKTDRLLR